MLTVNIYAGLVQQIYTGLVNIWYLIGLPHAWCWKLPLESVVYQTSYFHLPMSQRKSTEYDIDENSRKGLEYFVDLFN